MGKIKRRRKTEKKTEIYMVEIKPSHLTLLPSVEYRNN